MSRRELASNRPRHGAVPVGQTPTLNTPTNPLDGVIGNERQFVAALHIRRERLE